MSLLDKFSLRAKDDGLQSVLLTKGLAAKIKVWASSSSTFTAKQRWGRRTMVLAVKIRNILTNFMSVFTRVSQGAYVQGTLHLVTLGLFDMLSASYQA